MWKTTFALALAVATACAQQTANTGTLTGIVTDPTGLVVSGAKITVTNSDTGFTFEALTNDTGRYEVPFLNPGRYRLQVENAGFRTYERTGIELRAGESPRIDVVLEVGSVNDIVNVTAAAPLLETETAMSSAGLPNEIYQRIPVLQLRTYGVMDYLPGVTTEGGYSYYALGQRDRATASTLDGVSAKVPMEGASAGDYTLLITPSDSTEEVRVLTTGVPAEYGRMGAGAMIAVSKSGTNQLHGTAEDRWTPTPLIHETYLQQTPQSPVEYQDMSSTWGGPVYLPKIYDGRNKTFFYFGWQRQDERDSLGGTGTVPSLAEMSGDFSFGGLGLPVYDPRSTALVNGTWMRTQFPNNQIPQSEFDPVAKAFLALKPWATPNTPGFLQATGPNQNVLGNAITHSYRSRFSWNVDQQITSNHHLSARLTWNRHRRLVQNIIWNPSEDALLDPSNQFNPVDFYSPVITDTLTISPTTINEFRVGFTRYVYETFPLSYDQGWAQKLGIPNTPKDTFPAFTGEGFTINPGGYTQRIAQETDIADNVTKTIGPHTLKAGWETVRTSYNYFAAETPSGTYDFTNATAYPFQPNTGNPFAGFLLGAVTSATFTRNQATWLPRWWTHAAFIQDDFRPTKNLSLNLGLRWSYESPYNTKYGQQSEFNPTVTDPLTGMMGAITHPKGALSKPYYNNFQPRIGLAWTFRPKFVFRGSFGIQVPDLQSPTRGIAFEEYVATGNIQPVPGDPRMAFQLSQGPPTIPYTINPNGTVPYVGTNYSGRTATMWDANMRMPYVMTWSGGVQWQIAPTWLFETLYQGSSGVRLLEGWNINAIPLNVSTNPTVLNQIYAATQNYLPYPQFGAITEYSNFGHSSYHGITFRGEKRYGHGMTLNAFFVWSKALDESDGDTTATGITYYNRSLEKAVAGYDQTARFVSTFTWDLPFGVGHSHMSKAGWQNTIFGGWRFTWTNFMTSGMPFSVTFQGSPNKYLPGVSRPNILLPFDQAEVQNWSIGPNRYPANLQNPYLNAAAFAYPAAFTPGDLGRNTFRLPWTVWPQTSLAKQFVFKDGKKRLTVRYDVTNPITWPNLNGIGSTYNLSNLGNFGRFTAAGGLNNTGSQFVAAIVGRFEF